MVNAQADVRKKEREYAQLRAQAEYDRMILNKQHGEIKAYKKEIA